MYPGSGSSQRGEGGIGVILEGRSRVSMGFVPSQPHAANLSAELRKFFPCLFLPWGRSLGAAMRNFVPFIFEHLAADILQKVAELRKASGESYGRILGRVTESLWGPSLEAVWASKAEVAAELVVEPAGMEEHGGSRILKPWAPWVLPRPDGAKGVQCCKNIG